MGPSGPMGRCPQAGQRALSTSWRASTWRRVAVGHGRAELLEVLRLDRRRPRAPPRRAPRAAPSPCCPPRARSRRRHVSGLALREGEGLRLGCRGRCRRPGPPPRGPWRRRATPPLLILELHVKRCDASPGSPSRRAAGAHLGPLSVRSSGAPGSLAFLPPWAPWPSCRRGASCLPAPGSSGSSHGRATGLGLDRGNHVALRPVGAAVRITLAPPSNDLEAVQCRGGAAAGDDRDGAAPRASPRAWRRRPRRLTACRGGRGGGSYQAHVDASEWVHRARGGEFVTRARLQWSGADYGGRGEDHLAGGVVAGGGGAGHDQRRRTSPPGAPWPSWRRPGSDNQRPELLHERADAVLMRASWGFEYAVEPGGFSLMPAFSEPPHRSS